MGDYGPRLVVPIDVKKKPWQQKFPLHNRWHPEIPPVAEVQVAEFFRVEMVDFSGGGITKDYSAEDIKHADNSVVSPSSSLTHIFVSSPSFVLFTTAGTHLYPQLLRFTRMSSFGLKWWTGLEELLEIMTLPVM